MIYGVRKTTAGKPQYLISHRRTAAGRAVNQWTDEQFAALAWPCRMKATTDKLVNRLPGDVVPLDWSKG